MDSSMALACAAWASCSAERVSMAGSALWHTHTHIHTPRHALQPYVYTIGVPDAERARTANLVPTQKMYGHAHTRVLACMLRRNAYLSLPSIASLRGMLMARTAKMDASAPCHDGADWKACTGDTHKMTMSTATYSTYFHVTVPHQHLASVCVCNRVCVCVCVCVCVPCIRTCCTDTRYCNPNIAYVLSNNSLSR